MNNCERFSHYLQAYCDNELPEEIRVQMDNHLNACPRCRELVEDLKKVRTLITSMPTIEPGRHFADNVGDAVSRERLPRRIPAVSKVLQAAAAVVLTAGLGVLLYSHFAAPPQDQKEVAKSPGTPSRLPKEKQSEKRRKSGLPQAVQTEAKETPAPSPNGTDATRSKARPPTTPAEETETNRHSTKTAFGKRGVRSGGAAPAEAADTVQAPSQEKEANPPVRKMTCRRPASELVKGAGDRNIGAPESTQKRAVKTGVKAASRKVQASPEVDFWFVLPHSKSLLQSLHTSDEKKPGETLVVSLPVSALKKLKQAAGTGNWKDNKKAGEQLFAEFLPKDPEKKEATPSPGKTSDHSTAPPKPASQRSRTATKICIVKILLIPASGNEGKKQ